MDAKSLAKSKRAHSLHNSKKPHPARKPKPSPGPGGDGATGSKASGKPMKDKERATLSALPSNWDRYDEDFDLGSEEMSTKNASKTSDVVLPMSKGADYRHLLAEAQSQPHPSGYLDSSFSLDDVFPDEFKQTFGAMLSARGEGILSWILDDNFIVEDSGATARQEASFLSLNFQALEEQLAKVDISKRLFIEPDILPPDLCDEESHASCSEDSTPTQKSETAVSTSMPEHSAHGDISRKDMVLNQDADPVSEESAAHDHFRPIFIQGSQTSSPFKSDPAGEKFNRRVTLESRSKFIDSSATESLIKHDTFEAAAAEAELDKLLDSFGDTNLDDPPSTSISGTFLPVSMEGATVLPQVARNAPYQFQLASIDGNIDDVLDSLLEETSTVLSHNHSHQQSSLVNPMPPNIESSSSQAIPKSTALDDFGSWLDTI